MADAARDREPRDGNPTLRDRCRGEVSESIGRLWCDRERGDAARNRHGDLRGLGEKRCRSLRVCQRLAEGENVAASDAGVGAGNSFIEGHKIGLGGRCRSIGCSRVIVSKRQIDSGRYSITGTATVLLVPCTCSALRGGQGDGFICKGIFFIDHQFGGTRYGAWIKQIGIEDRAVQVGGHDDVPCSRR